MWRVELPNFTTPLLFMAPLLWIIVVYVQECTVNHKSIVTIIIILYHSYVCINEPANQKFPHHHPLYNVTNPCWLWGLSPKGPGTSMGLTIWKEKSENVLLEFKAKIVCKFFISQIFQNTQNSFKKKLCVANKNVFHILAFFEKKKVMNPPSFFLPVL